jgi:hypothetical protein
VLLLLRNNAMRVLVLREVAMRKVLCIMPMLQ